MDATDCSRPLLYKGVGCLREQYAAIQPLGRRALIVCGKSGARRSGALSDMTDALDKLSISYVVFDSIGPNPTLAMCDAARQAAPDAELVVGIGGGSALDAAKAVAVLCRNPGLPPDAIYDTSLAALPLVCVGTTAGTGSEVDYSSVITDGAGRKHSFTNPAVMPAISYADPAYTCTMDLRQTVSTALDAFCHCCEAIFSGKATPLSDRYAEEGLELLLPQLARLAEESFDPNDLTLREPLLYGSVLAGRAICVAGTCYPHPAGYCLTEKTGLPHGAACGVFELDFLRRTGPARPDHYRRLCAAAGGEERLYRVLARLTDNNITVSTAYAETMAQRIAGSGNFKRSLCPQTIDTVRAIIAPMIDGGQTTDIAGRWAFDAEGTK